MKSWTLSVLSNIKAMVVPDEKVGGGGCCFVSFILPAPALWPLHHRHSPTSISLHAPGESSSGLQQEVWLLTHLSCQPSPQQVSGGGNKHLCQLGMYACHICTCQGKVFKALPARRHCPVCPPYY